MSCKPFSKTRRVVVEVAREVSYGNDPGGGFQLLLYDNFNPIQVNPVVASIIEDSDSFIKQTAIFQSATQSFDGKTFLKGNDDNSLPDWTLLLEMCGLEKTYIGDTTVFIPTMKRSASGTIRAYLDSFKHIMTGSRGTFAMSASAGNLIDVNFSFLGQFSAANVIPSDNPSSIPAGSIPPRLCGMNLKITPEDTVVPIIPVVKGFSFSAGSQPQVVVEDNNSTKDILIDFFSDIDPKLSIVVEVNANRNYFKDIENNTRFAIEFDLGPQWHFSTDPSFRHSAALISAPYGDAQGIRTYSLNFDLTQDFQLTYQGI